MGKFTHSEGVECLRSCVGPGVESRPAASRESASHGYAPNASAFEVPPARPLLLGSPCLLTCVVLRWL